MEQYSPDTHVTPVANDGIVNRQAARDSLFLMAALRVVGSDVVDQVRVRNLSASGLMADFPGEIMQGTRIEIDVRGIGWVSGRVAWVADGRIGTVFDRQIDPMLARKPVGQGTHTPVFVKPILTRRNLR